MQWTEREVPAPAQQHYSKIWDGDGWQINRALDGSFILIDGVMPLMPASPVMGSFATLDDAQAEAERRGRPDWSGFDEDETTCN